MNNTEERKAKIGGAIHKILNKTLWRELTLKEYQRLVKLIAKAFDL